MSEPELEPLASELRSLLERGRDLPPPAGVQDRLLGRLEASLALPPANLPTGPGPAPAPAGAAAGVARASAGILAGKLPLAALMFVLGAGAGATVYSYLRPPARAEVRIITVPGPTPAPTPAPPPPRLVPPPVQVAVAEPDAGPPRVKHVDRPAPVEDPGSGRDTALAAERALIETARAALARGDAAAALGPLERHARDHAHGRLSEEREALYIQALVKAGQPGPAKARAARFREHFPHSLFMPLVDAAAPAESIP